MLASNRMYARRHLAQGSAGSAGCAGRQAQRQQRPNCVRNAMAYYDDDDCRKEMHFRIEPSRHHRSAAAIAASHYFAAVAVQTEVRQQCSARIHSLAEIGGVDFFTLFLMQTKLRLNSEIVHVLTFDRFKNSASVSMSVPKINPVLYATFLGNTQITPQGVT